MTWAMISKQQELNEITIAYSERKNQIAREFEEIKNEVTVEQNLYENIIRSLLLKYISEVVHYIN